MTRVYNLQRDPDSGELFAIGKSDRPYSFDEVRALEAGLLRGDRLARASLIDLDLGLDDDGEPAAPETVAARKKRARLSGWPPRASAYRRKLAWERTRMQRRQWRSVWRSTAYAQHPDRPETASGAPM
jgi:hypothetical protein